METIKREPIYVKDKCYRCSASDAAYRVHIATGAITVKVLLCAECAALPAKDILAKTLGLKYLSASQTKGET